MGDKGHEFEIAGVKTTKIQDEVYRQMFRVDAGIPAADLDLAMSLVRAWAAVEREPEDSDLRTWLRVVSPCCLQMIDALRRCHQARQDWVN